MLALPIFCTRFFFSLVLVLAVLVAAGSVQAQFNPQRTFPNTNSTIGVFVDQLPGGMTDAQNRFAATHYAGTQKLTTNLIDPIRAYNPNFIMLQYRLGVRDSGDATVWIHNNTWSSDWATVNAHEEWFVHVNGDSTATGRLYQQYGSIKEWIMDAGGVINGVPIGNSYGAFWSSATLADNAASHADGTFADACVLPWAPNTSNSPVGGPPCTAYIPDIEAYYAYVYHQYVANNQYLIPNLGAMVTTADTTQGYYNNVHGAMSENFAVKTSDWSLEKNRTLKLLNNGKVWIAQNGVSSNSDVASRAWYMANYLLVKSSQSFINIIPASGSQLYWWPEYDLDMGAPTDALPANISAYRLSSGLYVRHYQNGYVLVNPTGAALTYTFGANDTRYLATFSGGGNVGANGNAPAGSLTYVLQSGGTISVPAWSGEMFVVPEPATLAMLAGGLFALIRRCK